MLLLFALAESGRQQIDMDHLCFECNENRTSSIYTEQLLYLLYWDKSAPKRYFARFP